MGDDAKHSKATLTFDRSQLAKLAASTRGEAEESFADLAADESADEWAVEPVPPTAQGSAPTPRPTLGRADTISDPLTMALLAEVARNSQTVDFDPADIAQAMRGPQASDEAAPADVPHPHVKRRG